MAQLTRTIDEDPRRGPSTLGPTPGAVLLFTGGAPQLAARAVTPSGRLSVGRQGTQLAIDDARVSRHHATLRLEGGRIRVVDEDSRNGTFVDGQRVVREAVVALPAVLRVGRSVCLLDADVRRFVGVSTMERGDAVVGPTLDRVWQAISDAAQSNDALLITGSSGSGKELAARLFHAQGPHASGPLVAVNCATVPEGLAERLLFGTRKGAYSGASEHALGYVQAAHGGTLFLDELGELELAVQAKLLRVLETREVWPLGASQPVKVDIRVCAATLRDLRERIATGHFRQDLYYRIAQPELQLPSLRERREEIPWLIARELAAAEGRLSCDASLVEACLLREWPGNVRELRAELRRAMRHARGAGSTQVCAHNLADAAGRPLLGPAASGFPVAMPTAESYSREQIEAALEREQGNVSKAARALGLHRNQLRRWLARAASSARDQ